jgi:CDGSH-type Zn-finger protein|tara:strand:+ start:45 stop:497 length:453 start_codon:yes stop_codon:yes gene_type:complete
MTKSLEEELIDLGASGVQDGKKGPSTNEKDKADVDLEDIPIIHVGGAACYTNQVALEVEGRFKIVHTDGTEEIIEGKTPLCSCGQSKSKPYCDQTHQQFLADEDNPNSKVLWEYLTNKERYEILNGIKLDHKKINKRHIGAKPPWMEDNN